MAEFTAPEALFRDVCEVDAFILDLIASPRTSMWSWPSYYLLYVNVDRIGYLLEQASRLFDPSVEGIGAPHDVDEFVEATNEFFDTVRGRQQSIVESLWPLARNTSIPVEQRALRERWRAHMHPKSDWYQAFVRDYCPGRVSVDGLVLERTVLLTDPPPGCERFPLVDSADLLQRQRFDLSTREARQALSETTRNAAIAHGKVFGAMKDFLMEHCTMTDLIHPSSA